MEMFVQTKMRPEHNASTALQEKQHNTEQPQSQKELEGEKDKSAPKASRGQSVLPAVLTILLLIPLLLVIAIGAFICWRKNSMCGNKAMMQCTEDSLNSTNLRQTGFCPQNSHILKTILTCLCTILPQQRSLHKASAVEEKTIQTLNF